MFNSLFSTIKCICTQEQEISLPRDEDLVLVYSEGSIYNTGHLQNKIKKQVNEICADFAATIDVNKKTQYTYQIENIKVALS